MKTNDTTNPFVFIEPIKRSFFARLFGIKDCRNAFIEINNAIASVQRPALVDAEKIKIIHNKYGTECLSRLTPQSGKLYSCYLKFLFAALTKAELSKIGLADLRAIQIAFNLSDEYVAQLNFQTGQLIYRQALLKALSDETIDEREEVELLHLGRQLNLDENTISELFASELQRLITEKVNDALEDGEFSPSEELHIKTLCDRFNISPIYEDALQASINEARDIWKARHGELNAINTDLALMRNEVCYEYMPIEWWEVRRNAFTTMRTHNLQFDRPRPSSIAMSYAPILEDCLLQIDSGTLYITNKRVLFVGESNTSTIPYKKIIKVIQYRDGIKINKGSGRSPYLIGDHTLILGALINRLISQ